MKIEMNGTLQYLRNNLPQSGRQLFLLDGSGALLSAFFLGLVLRQFEPVFGMPQDTLTTLALMACAFAGYSWFCYFLVKDKWPTFLRVIMVVNILYGCLSLLLVYRHFAELTKLGLAYFVLELIVLAGVVCVEYYAIRNTVVK
ncbi:MAG: hypothetical protein ACI81P_000757 [Neolewinella sp.]|jgi:hypothetical protein